MGKVYKLKYVNIEPYVKDYLNRNISVKEIAKATNISTTSVYALLNKYYTDNRLKKPEIIYHKEKKENYFKKYAEQYENGTITIKQIMQEENLAECTIRNKIQEYYIQENKEKPKILNKYSKKNIHLEKYLKQYENEEITIEKIAEKENVSYTTVQKNMQKYYEQKHINIEQVRKKRFPNIDANIEYYVQQYENGKISVEQIAKELEKGKRDTYNEMRKYYKYIGKQMPREIVAKDPIRYFLEQGLTPEQIKAEARKRNKIVLDEQIEKILKEKNETER